MAGTAFMSACISMTSTMEALVHDQQVALERIVVTALEPAGLRVGFEQPVDGASLKSGRFGHAFGSPASGRAEQNLHAFRCENAQNRIDDGRLADARVRRS